MTTHSDSQELTEEIRVRISPDLKKAFKLKVVQDDTDISTVIRRLIENYVSAE